MERLHRGDQIQAGQPPEIARMDQLHMLDAMTKVRQVPGVLIGAQLFEGHQGLMVGPVANRMHRHTQSDVGSRASKLEQLLAVDIQDASVSRFGVVWIKHRCRARTEGTVHEDLDGADPQMIITKPSAQTEVARLSEELDWNALRNTEFEPALEPKLLERHKAVAAIEIVDRRQAEFPKFDLRPVNSVRQIAEVGLGHKTADQ